MAFPYVLPHHHHQQQHHRMGRKAARGTIAMLLLDENQESNIKNNNQSNCNSWRTPIPSTNSAFHGYHFGRQQQQQQYHHEDTKWIPSQPTPCHNLWPTGENMMLHSHYDYQKQYHDHHHVSSTTLINYDNNFQNNLEKSSMDDHHKVNGGTIMIQDSTVSVEDLPRALEKHQCGVVSRAIYPSGWTPYSSTIIKQDDNCVQETTDGPSKTTTMTTKITSTMDCCSIPSNKRDRACYESSTTTTSCTTTSAADASHRDSLDRQAKRFHDNSGQAFLLKGTPPVR